MPEPDVPKVDATPRPTTFWQYMVVYPALAMALAGAVPTVLREVAAWRLGVRSSQLELVQEQQRLWERNVACLTHQGVYEADGPDNLTVKVSLCTSGDVLLRYYQNDWTPQFKWVGKPPAPTWRKGAPPAAEP